MCYNKNATINCNGALGRFPLRTVAFRGHGFSLLEKPTLRGLQTRAGTGTARCSSHRNPLRLLAPSKTFVPAGVNGPPLQTTIVIVKSNCTVLLLNTMLAKEIHEDSLKKKTAFSACDIFHRSFPCPAGKRRR